MKGSATSQICPEKDWWTPAQTKLKQKSIDTHNLWKAEGKPRHGPIHQERITTRAVYKRETRAAQRAPKQASWNRMHSALLMKDNDSFWKSWRHLYGKNKNDISPVVEGLTASKDIATVFMEQFKANCQPNNEEKVTIMNEKFTNEYREYNLRHKNNCDCNSFQVSLENVIDAVLSMKSGKCSDTDEISAEHFLNGPLNLFLRFQSLFNAMLHHSFVPRQFRLGFIVPIAKDNTGNLSDKNNYRGITISPIPSKLFEHVLKEVFYAHLSTSNVQFGYKKKKIDLSCSLLFKRNS